MQFPKNGHSQGPHDNTSKVFINYQLNTKINASGRAEYAIVNKINMLVYHNESLTKYPERTRYRLKRLAMV